MMATAPGCAGTCKSCCLCPPWGAALDACHLPPLSQGKPSCPRTSLFHRVSPPLSTDSLKENVTNLQLELASLGQLSGEAVLKKKPENGNSPGF